MLEVDYYWKYGYASPSCTSLEYAWKTGGKSMLGMPKQFQDMAWKAPHAERLDQSKVLRPEAKTLFSPTSRQQHKGMTFECFFEELETGNPKSVLLAETSDEEEIDF